MADEVIRQTLANHAKPDGSVDNLIATMAATHASQAGVASLQNIIL